MHLWRLLLWRIVLMLVLWPGLVAAQQTVAVTFHTAEATNANGTTPTVIGFDAVSVQNTVASSWDGTFNWEASFDGTNFVSVKCRNVATGGVSTTAVGAGAYVCPLTGAQSFRARISGRTTGTTTASGRLIRGVSGVVSDDTGGTFTLQASVTRAVTTIGTAITGLDRFKTLVVTLDITAAERDSGDETYDVYVVTSDGVSSWDLVHFPQVATTGAKRYTATIVHDLLPQRVTTAVPGVASNESGTLKTDTQGSDQGTRTLVAGTIRHGPWGSSVNHHVVIAGTVATGITYSITIMAK